MILSFPLKEGSSKLSSKESGLCLWEPMKDMQKWALLQYCNTMCLANVSHSLHTSKRRCMRLFFAYLGTHLLETQTSHPKVPSTDHCHAEDPGQDEHLGSPHMHQVKFKRFSCCLTVICKSASEPSLVLLTSPLFYLNMYVFSTSFKPWKIYMVTS